MRERVQIANYEAFGAKVKAWSAGKDPIPETLEELKTQLAAAQVGATIPSWVKKVKVVVSDEDTMVIRLPQKGLIAESEERLRQAGSDYPVPPIYERVFQSKPIIEDKLAFHAARIGDYTISMCG